MKFDYDSAMRIFMRVSIPLVCIVFFKYHIDKIFASIPLGYGFKFALVSIFVFYILGSLAVLALASMWQLTQIKGYWKHYKKRALYPLLIGIATILYVILGRGINSEIFESRKIYEAYKESTAAGQIITLRANFKCEIINYSFGISDYHYALWRKSNDSIFIAGDTGRVLPSDTFVIINGHLNPITNKKDSLGNYIYYAYLLNVKPD